ncbi:hypothetical protein JCM6882_003498 [Rhodosporidiobolus microsporus]
METQKKKKPPACDRCKAKRVLCHPDPRGCPRCVEKGVDISPALAKHLFDCFPQTPQYCHPVVETTIRDTLEALNWNVDLLPLSSRALAYAMFAVAALVSFSPEIIGHDGPCPTSWAAVSADGQDLRAFGRRRKAACLRLQADALRCAREADVMIEPTLENTATCVLLNSLMDLDEQSPTSRPFHAAFLSHVRSSAESAGVEPLPLHAVRWGCYLAVQGLADISEGRFSLTRFDELLFVGGDPPEPVAYSKGLQATLQRPVDRSLWPDLKPFCLLVLQTTRNLTADVLGAHARRRPLDEHGLLRSLEALHHLRTGSCHFADIMDRLLEPYQPLEVNLFPGGPTKSGKINRAGALGAMRCFTVWTWTGCVLPLYREIQRRSRLNHANPQSSFASPDPATRLAAERLDVYLKQARELCFYALEGVIEICPDAPVTMVALNRRGTVPEWAQFLLEELEAGTTPRQACQRFVEPLVISLKHHGYIYASATVDDIIARLERFLFSSPHPALPSFSAALDPLIPDHFDANGGGLPVPPTPTPLVSGAAPPSSFPSTSMASDPSASLSATVMPSVLAPGMSSTGPSSSVAGAQESLPGFMVGESWEYDTFWPIW